jgi:hypothetical protein
VSGRTLVVAELDAWSDLTAWIESTDWASRVSSLGGFGLLLAWDGEPPSFDEVATLARALIRDGLYFFGAWGPGSDRVEYAVDVVDVSLAVEAKAPADSPIVMTTSATEGPLADALYELWDLAPRDDGMPAGPARVVVTLAAPLRAAEVRAYFEAAADS